MAKKTSAAVKKSAQKTGVARKTSVKKAATPATTPADGPRRYWLFKSEPESFSIDDLAAAPGQTTFWDGVRNYQARNTLRDTVRIGDGVLFYHSNADPLAVVGTCRVVKTGYPDHTAFDPQDHHYDPKSDPDSPTWFMVDVQLVQKFPQPVTRETMLQHKGLKSMVLLQRGSRLSIQPVSADEWRIVHELAGVADALSGRAE